MVCTGLNDDIGSLRNEGDLGASNRAHLCAVRVELDEIEDLAIAVLVLRLSRISP